MSQHWKTNADKNCEYAFFAQTEDDRLHVWCKWDGCIHIDDYDEPVEDRNSQKAKDTDSCYMHICSIDRFIAQLQQLKRLAANHFGNNGYWQPEIIEAQKRIE